MRDEQTPAANGRQQHAWRGFVLACAAAASVVGCGSDEPEPRVAVTCQPGTIRLDITNVGKQPARYTVTIGISSEGLQQTEQYSSNTVDPRQTVTVTDDRPSEKETCTVKSTKVYPQ